MKKYLFVFYVLLVRNFNLGKRYTKFMTLLWVHKFICWLVAWKFLTGRHIINCPITTWHHTKDWKDTEQLPREDTIIKLTIGFFTQRSHSMTYSRRVSVRIKQLLFWEINIYIYFPVNDHVFCTMQLWSVFLKHVDKLSWKDVFSFLFA